MPEDRPWGPFGGDLMYMERIARIRALRVAVGLVCGKDRGHWALVRLKQAERDLAELPAAEAAIDQLPSLERRDVISAFGRYGL